MYELTLNPTTETRTRTVTKTGTRTVTNADGTTSTETYTYEEEEEYTVTILEVTLTAKDLNVVAAGHMDSEQKEIYALYNETHGLTQQFYTPLNLYWYNYVSSYYGYRINPVTGRNSSTGALTLQFRQEQPSLRRWMAQSQRLLTTVITGIIL